MEVAAHGAPSALRAADEPPAFEVFDPEGASRFVLVCDHAANRVPRSLGTLGLDPDRLGEHIGWDPGAAIVARRLAAGIGAPMVASGYSRLVIDCNRPLHSAESIPEQSAGVAIPGNLGLSAEERGLRVDAFFRPYHQAIDRLLDDPGRRPRLLLSIHSFAPVLDGRPRPWHVGVSARRDRWLAGLLLRGLSACPGLTVGDDEPYPIEDDFDYTIPAHGEARGLPSAMIEIRQDGLRTAAEAAGWAARLASICRQIEADARPPAG